MRNVYRYAAAIRFDYFVYFDFHEIINIIRRIDVIIAENFRSELRCRRMKRTWCSSISLFLVSRAANRKLTN